MADTMNNLRAILRREYEEQRFVSIRFLEDHITEEKVNSHLKAEGIPSSLDDVKKVVAEGKRLFAILVLLAREDEAAVILDGIQDDMLPFLTKKDIPSMLGRSPEQISAFWDHQAKFPPDLTLQQNLRELPSSMELPLTVMSPTRTQYGSFGQVYQVKVAGGYIEGCGPNQALAWKKIHTRGSPPWDKALQEVYTLKARRHKSIVPLLACWVERPQESHDKCLHLLFPWAETNMKEWMNRSQAPPLPVSLRRRKEFLYDTVQSLLSALSYIHKEIDGSVASHFDLKPANIILFNNQTWKICDFGKSVLKNLDNGSETEGLHGLGTRTYQPPEYATGKRFGRAFDVWSMGCIIIELAILLVYGWVTQKLQEFTTARTKNGNPNDPFYDNMPEVDLWIKNLVRDDGSYNISSLMRTARDMLNTEPEARLYSWEAYLDLYERLNPNETVEDRRKRMKEFVPRYKGGPISSKENPRARASIEKNSIREEYLAQMGWPKPPVQSTSLVQDFLKKSNSKPTRDEVREIFSLTHEDYGDDIHRRDLATRFANAIVPADITFSETTELCQQSRAWSAMKPLEDRINVVGILEEEMSVNIVFPHEMAPLSWAARIGNAAAAN